MDERTPRFGAWEPGVVEVEFKEGVRPEFISRPTGPAKEITSPENVNLSEMNQILRQFQLQQAESTFQTTPEEAVRAQSVARDGGIEVPNLRNFVTLHFPPSADVKRIAQELNELPYVLRAYPVPKVIPPSTPLDEPLVGTSDQAEVDPNTDLENQWYIFRCRANNIWGTSSGNDVIIADVDWGYLTSHQDLASRLDLSHAYNSYDGSNNVSHGDYIYHGTAVMGLAGGADNSVGMAGFAFNAILWPIQANSGPGTAIGGDSWARAIEWVRTADSGGRRKVIILEVQTGSFGNIEMWGSVNTAIRTAIGSGVIVCVAAGNGDRDAGLNDEGDPIMATGSILVGATEYHPSENRRASFSNYGSRIVVSAPGDGSHDVTCDIFSDSAYTNYFGGTSGATPKVAGTVAMMLSVNPNLTQQEIVTILNSTGTPVISDPSKPVGTFLNSETALRRAAALNLPITSITANGDDGTNRPTNAIDNNLNTRWSKNGVGSWIQADLGAQKLIYYMEIAWHNGNQRQNNFVISVSTNGTNFVNVFTGRSSGRTLSPEIYDFPDVTARYVRITVNGNTQNNWASITELDVYGS
jgi:subtilisin family serine protease